MLIQLPDDVCKANAAFIVRACNAHDDLVAALGRCLCYLADLNGSSPFDKSAYGLDMAQRAKALQSVALSALAKAKS